LINRTQSLTGIPVVNDGVKTVEADGRLQVVVRWQRTRGLWSRFMPPVLERTVKLDEVGAFVFRLIDGRRNVRQIIEEFVRRYRANRREAELSTVAFLRSLAERRVISIVIK
jgi:hypothetical protein